MHFNRNGLFKPSKLIFSALTQRQEVPGSGKVKCLKPQEKINILNFSQSAREDETWKWNLACRRRINQMVFFFVRRGNKFHERAKESEHFHNFLYAIATIHNFTIRVYTLDFSSLLVCWWTSQASKLISLSSSLVSNDTYRRISVCALSRGE